MIDKIVDGDFFRDLCDIQWHQEMPDKEHIIMYANSEEYISAIDVIYENPERTFTLITHNSDYSLSVGGPMPSNLKVWYGQNIDSTMPNVKPLPIGLENTKWHPVKREILNLALPARTNPHRHLKALCQFNPETYKKERQGLLSMVLKNEIAADPFYAINGADFGFYVDNLTRYRFCLCPRGNGVDTHRLWEAILLGCIPIAKKHGCYNYEEKLPIVFINSWYEVTEKFLESQFEKFDKTLLNTPLLFKEYWRNKIYEDSGS